MSRFSDFFIRVIAREAAYPPAPFLKAGSSWSKMSRFDSTAGIISWKNEGRFPSYAIYEVKKKKGSVVCERENGRPRATWLPCLHCAWNDIQYDCQTGTPFQVWEQCCNAVCRKEGTVRGASNGYYSLWLYVYGGKCISIMRSKHVRTPYAVRRTYSMNMHWLFHVKVLEEFSRVHWFKQSLHDSAIVHNYVLAILVWVNICVVVRSLVRQSMYYIYNVQVFR